MNDYAYMDGNQMYPEMYVHMKVDIITEGQHNGMILHQSVTTGPNGELHISTMPEFPHDWTKRGIPFANNAVGPAATIDPSRMIGWNDQSTQADDEKEKRRKHRRKHRHDSEKRHRRRTDGDADTISNGGDSITRPDVGAVDLDSTPEYMLPDDSYTRLRREGRTLPGAVPVFPMSNRPVPPPRRYFDDPLYEEELQSICDSLVLPDRVRLNIFEEVEPARFADADIKRMESNKRPIIQHPVDTEHETDAEQSASNATAPSDGRLSQRSEPRQIYNAIPVETITDTVTTTTTVEVFRTTNDPNNPAEHIILPPPPVPGATKLQPQILRADGPAHELFTHTTSETTINDAMSQVPRSALRRLEQRSIQPPHSPANSQSSTPQPSQPRRLIKETLIDDPGIPLRTSNGRHYPPSATAHNDQQRARFPPERLTSSFASHGGQSTLTSMLKQTPEPLPRPAQLLPTTTPIRQRTDARTEQSESFSNHTSLASINRQPLPPPTDRSPKMHLSMSPMTTTDFPSELPDLPPQISPRHIIKVESLSSLSEYLPPPSPLPPISLAQQEKQLEQELSDRAKERELAELADQMFSFDRTQVKVTNAKNRPAFRPPPIPTESQLRPFQVPSTGTSEELSYHSEDSSNNGFPPAPSPLDFSRNQSSAPSDKIHEIYTTKKSPTASPHNLSFERPPTKGGSSSSHNSSIDEERSGLSSAAPHNIFTEQQTTTTIINQREIYTIEETHTSNEILSSSSEDLTANDRRNTVSSYGKPDSRQSTLLKNSVIKQNTGGLSSSRSSIDSERSSVSGMMHSKGLLTPRQENGSDGENLSDYLQGRLTPLGQDLNGLYYVDESVKSQDSVISEASNRADRSHEYFDRHRQEEHLLPPPEPRSFAEIMRMSTSPPPPPPREVRFDPVPIVRQSSSSSSVSSVASARAYQDDPPRFAQVLSREPIRYDIQPAYGEARTEPVSALADRMRQMLEREEESLRLRSTVNTQL